MTDVSELIERVARAIFIARSWQTAMVGDWDEVTDNKRENFRSLARAAIEASGVQSLSERVAGFDEALTPSGDTKAAYIGEFKFDIMVPSIDEEDDEPIAQSVDVPWTTVKEIMAAIKARVLTKEGIENG